MLEEPQDAWYLRGSRWMTGMREGSSANFAGAVNKLPEGVDFLQEEE
jgi:hypothetical protein